MSCKTDLISRLRSLFQITQFSHQYLSLLGSKEKAAPVRTRKGACVLLTRRRSSNVNVVPVEVVLYKVTDDFCQRLYSLGVGNLVHQPHHHVYVAVCRQDTSLNEALFADDLKMQFVTDAVRQLTDELTLGASVPLSEWVNPIYLGEKHSHFLSEISSWQAFEETVLGQILEHSRQLLLN